MKKLIWLVPFFLMACGTETQPKGQATFRTFKNSGSAQIEYTGSLAAKREYGTTAESYTSCYRYDILGEQTTVLMIRPDETGRAHESVEFTINRDIYKPQEWSFGFLKIDLAELGKFQGNDETACERKISIEGDSLSFNVRCDQLRNVDGKLLTIHAQGRCSINEIEIP